MSDIKGLIMHQGSNGVRSEIAAKITYLLQAGTIHLLSSEGLASADDCARILQLRVETSHSVGKEILGVDHTFSRLVRMEPEQKIRVTHLRSEEDQISAYSTGDLESSFSYTLTKRTGTKLEWLSLCGAD